MPPYTINPGLPPGFFFAREDTTHHKAHKGHRGHRETQTAPKPTPCVAGMNRPKRLTPPRQGGWQGLLASRVELDTLHWRRAGPEPAAGGTACLQAVWNSTRRIGGGPHPEPAAAMQDFRRARHSFLVARRRLDIITPLASASARVSAPPPIRSIQETGS